MRNSCLKCSGRSCLSVSGGGQEGRQIVDAFGQVGESDHLVRGALRRIARWIGSVDNARLDELLLHLAQRGQRRLRAAGWQLRQLQLDLSCARA